MAIGLHREHSKENNTMRIPLIAGAAFLCAAGAFAQTSQIPGATTPTSVSANQSMTLIGCVGGGATAADPFMLSNVSLGGVAQSPGQTATSGAQAPTGATGAGAATGTSSTPMTPPSATSTGIAAATPSPTTAGTTGTVGTSSTAGTVGSSSAAQRPTTATGAATATGTSGMRTGATGTTSSVDTNGYRLSGYDVSGFRGQRVQIIGSLAEPGTGSSGSTTATRTTPREFVVQSVQPMSGSCPQ
jgi:hypothetical protein